MLLGAKKVAGSADLEVAECDLETLAELVQPGDHVESLVRVLGQRPARVVQEVRICAPARTTDSTAQLIELREAEPIRALDDDRVHVRDVETRFDDRRADEDVVLRRFEFDHHLGELVLGHLSVTDDDSS